MNLPANIPVSTIMSTQLVVLNTTDGLEKAERLFKKHRIRHIPVIERNKKIVGMLSLTDLLRISFADGAYEDEEDIETVIYDMFTLPQVMAKNVKSVSPKTTIREVAELLAKEEFHALPVVQDGDLVGIVTTTDLIRYLLSQY
ncbi:CBS domain-containing protein [Robiginitalea marina]|uniref:CBS domain-containing protein n=1 Tax=Robiginitalea marina TaxID=2954105 RepID=A0ABT1AXL9_9FLAO|nr:CBS domain-containing protein [Robiginitalea marina]MCO5724788.1 CBS domain-containing protein [Robiginitalea marina]